MNNFRSGDPDSGNSMPAYETFLEEIHSSYPEGDLPKAFNRIKWFIENVKVCSDGTPITYRLIMDQYISHIRQWNSRYLKKEQEGYLSKEAEEKRKNLFDFIGCGWYERVWLVSSGDTERDKYLFGNYSIKYLCRQLAEFQKTYCENEQTKVP